ncbi:sigma-54-dependent transcriptional regulator [Larkinella humicola]|uniref:Sigma-54-dependent Fis family transcriptional regulator n=1 Tax=Larkinella humicola TaxID=2607654 RepID=A0A5N1JG72_9BACT|nr:sigma-54 dependent transcriptional regulator [Larkinella humicola]KAA9354719.1 sigma-54-dependent Fis family transcriptional regulator [Larkinella humicola]
MSKLLIIDDDVDVLSAAKLLLKRHYPQVDIEKNPERIPFLITNGSYDLVLLDMNFQRDNSSGREGFLWLDRILDIKPTTAVVLITAYGDVEMAVRAIKSGARDFVLKPWENDKLLATLQSALEGRKDDSNGLSKTSSPAGSASVGGKSQNQSGYIAVSPSMRQVFATVERVAETDANVLILGENGTGKDVVARALHQRSLRRDKPFVSVDLGALSDSLFESELFGHVKGAFTDAREDRTGRFEEAQGGTIFLDEIGNISLPQQAKLLTVLQQRVVTRLGTNKPKNIDVRLICATNSPIYQHVSDRSFRQDLLYRINTIEIHIPPLRERPEDIVPLAEHFLKQYRKQYNRKVASISPALTRQLQQYRWPGNIRELQHAIERAVILAQGNVLEPEDFYFGTSTPAAIPTDKDLPFQENLQIEDMEKKMIQQAMQKYHGNITDIARELGLSRQALYRRLEKYGL